MHSVNYQKEKRYSLMDFVEKEWHQEQNSSCCNCHVIVTCRSLLWTLLSLVATLTVVSAVITPQWLIGKEREKNAFRSGNRTKYLLHEPSSDYDDYYDNTKTFTPTLGIFNRCTQIQGFTDFYTGSVHCARFVTSFGLPDEDFPDAWKASLILFTIAVAILGFASCSAVLSLCMRVCFQKSIFTITGFVQTISGILLIIATVLYPVGWGTKRVTRVCGHQASPFVMADCEMGWAFYALMVGIGLVFLCAGLSIQADKGTSTDKVESEIADGKTLICVL